MTRTSRRRWLRTVLVGGAAVAAGPRRVAAAEMPPEWAPLAAAAKKDGSWPARCWRASSGCAAA